MIEDEQVWQSREITGSADLVCESCGRPVGAIQLLPVDSGPIADGGSIMRICASCLEAIGRGTAPLELDDETDDPERRV